MSQGHIPGAQEPTKVTAWPTDEHFCERMGICNAPQVRASILGAQEISGEGWSRVGLAQWLGPRLVGRSEPGGSRFDSPFLRFV